MVGRKRGAPAASSPRATRSSARAASQKAGSRSTARRTPAGRDAAVPDIYREMLGEARAEMPARDPGALTRHLKRKRPGEGRPARRETPAKSARLDLFGDMVSGDEQLEFEKDTLPRPTVQTMLRESDDDDEGTDIDFEDVAIEGNQPSAAAGAVGDSKDLNLDLSAHMAAAAARRVDRRKTISREEKERRVEIHKVHLACLLAHAELRNRWCNDPRVQDALRPLLPQKTVAALNPRANLNQFSRTESLRKGLQEAKEIFKMKYSITERGLRRALWAENEEQLKNYQLPDDIESTLEKSDFIQAAKKCRGSRDVGAQLFCALLRSVGVEARLVCSLQPLSFVPGGPTMPKQRAAQTPTKQPSKPSQGEIYAAAVAKHETKFPEFQAGATTPSPRRRLGHPHAAAYHVPSPSGPSRPSPPAPVAQTPRKIRGESPFPVYWVEVLDVAHQKWHPVDPLVTGTQWKPHVLEPPASDTANSMAYVIAFAADASARDVTRRYAKAYAAKTRKLRIDGGTTTATPNSSSPSPDADANARWYRRLLRRYTHPHHQTTDLHQIETHELTAAAAREPMPRNVADFKDHPLYALERHLRRHEVLIPEAQALGTVGAGAKAPLERVYRRGDVRVARTRERWMRMGRVVRVGEEPVKVLVRKRGRKGRDEDDGYDDDPDRVGLFGDEVNTAVAAAVGPGAVGSPLYTLDQTDAYVPPPVVDGRVPKNKFGNVEVYVPSMVPRGGVHVPHEGAARAAFILGVDYAPALTGFEFRGRQGTAVLRGVVVPQEAGEAVWAVIEGLADLEAEEERERRSRQALRMWSRFLKGLRIRERIWAGVDETAEAEAREGKGKGKEVVEQEEEGRGEDEEEDVDMGDVVSDEDMGGGGFFVPDEEDEDDAGGGGFVVE